MNNKQREESLTLEMLEAIHEESDVTQRRLARRLDVALGLANSYLKRCVRKGLVKIQQAPPNRYLYYLTPKGFAEKARLTGRYLSYSLEFYRRAGESCLRAFAHCRRRGYARVALRGVSDLGEIASIRAMDAGVEIVAVCDPESSRERFLGLPVVATLEECGDVDAVVLTDLANPEAARRALRVALPQERVVVPDILGLPAED